MRIGQGIDVHRFSNEPGRLVLLGVEIAASRSLAGTSDADVGAHAVADALLGAAAIGDLGEHFPSSDAQWHGADSMEILKSVAGMVAAAGFELINIDVTIVAESIRIAGHRENMRQRLAAATGLDAGAVSVKATSTDRLGFTGRDEGIAALAVAAVTERAS